MGKRHPNYRLVKINLSYSIDELARLLGLHKHTVRGWQKVGLQPVGNQRPLIFRGAVVREFLEDRRARSKRPCGPGKIYCLPCRAPQRPAGDMVDYVTIDGATGNLRGICPICGRWIHRRVNLARLAAVAGDLDVAFSGAEERIGESIGPSVNLDPVSEDIDDELQ